MADQQTTSCELNVQSPFILYADCYVEYDGRASSKLDRGNYLILYKADGSLLIHGADKTIPRNYQQPGAKLKQDGNKIISERKNEEINITLYNIIYYHILTDWSRTNIKICKTESELVDKLVHNITDYINDSVNVVREYHTDMGKVDLCVEDIHGTRHLIEVKRKKATKNTSNQLRKYVDCVENSIGYIAAPDISDITLKHLDLVGYKYIKIDFDR